MNKERMGNLLEPLFEELQKEYGRLLRVGVKLEIEWQPFTEYERVTLSHRFKVCNIPDIGLGFEMRREEIE